MTRHQAKFSPLVLLSLLFACSQDPNIAIPEAVRHSADENVGIGEKEPAPEVIESNDTIGPENQEPLQEADSSQEEPTTPVSTDEALPSTSSPLPLPVPAPAPAPEPAPLPVPETPEVPNPQSPQPEIPLPETPKPTPTPTPTPIPEVKGPIADGKYLLQGVGSKKCLDAPGGLTAHGTPMQIWGCNDTNLNQIMTVQWIDDKKAYKILTSTGRQLQVEKDKVSATSPLILGDATNGAHGLWIIERWGNAVEYRLRLKDKTLLMDVTKGGTADATKVIVNNTFQPVHSQQQWLFLKVK